MKNQNPASSLKPAMEKEKVNSGRTKMKTERCFQYLDETFKAMGDPTKTKIIYALSQENQLCVGDIAAIIGTSNSVISHQLRTLRNMKLVNYHKVGKMIYYSLNDIYINHLFAKGLRHVEDQ